MDTPAVRSEIEPVGANTQSLRYVILLSTITAISGFLFGYNTAVINGVLLFLRRQFAPSDLPGLCRRAPESLGCSASVPFLRVRLPGSPVA